MFVIVKALLERLYTGIPLDYDMATDLFIHIIHPDTHPYQVAAALSYYNTRLPELSEFSAFYDGMMLQALSMDTQGIPTIDVCGTGGDGKDTFNISTLAAFVCAGAGVYVAKHGNYAVSSACGSSDVLEYLGIRLSQNPDILLRQLDQANICILHAPLFHPAMKHVAPIRKAMGVKTLFNLLGPICNPAHNEFQCTGTFKPEVAYLYHQLFMEKKEGYTVFYDMAGYDEISLQGNIILYSNGKQKTWLHLDFPFTVADAHDIAGGNSIADHAAIFMQVLNNQCTEAQRNVVVVNAAVAIHTYFPNLSFDDAMTMAMQSLISGKAKESFMKMKNLQQ